MSPSTYAPLLTLLPTARDSDRPWLVCYGPHQRTELTGHVLAMWHAKTAALITAESAGPPSESGPVHIGTGAHWRGVTWACGAWLAGRGVLTGDGRSVEAAGLAPGTSIALTQERLCPTAEIQVLAPDQDLAPRWPGELPPLVLDGAADLMAYPDHFAPVPAGDEVCLTEVGPEASPGSAQEAGAVAAPGSGGDQGVSLRTYRVSDLTDSVTSRPSSRVGQGQSNRDGDRDSDRDSNRDSNRGTGLERRRGGAALVRERGLGPTLRGVLAAWRAGLTAVLLTEDADDDVAASAARQEGAAPLPRP